MARAALSRHHRRSIPGSTTPATAIQFMHRKRLMMHSWFSPLVATNPKNNTAPLVDRKPLTMGALEPISRKLDCSAIARWPRFSSIPDLGARPPSQANPRPAVKFILTNATLQCSAFRFPDRDHLLRVRTCELTSAGKTAAPPDLGEILKLARSPTCSSLPSRLYLPCR
jgi:hypothetical protein